MLNYEVQGTSTLCSVSNTYWLTPWSRVLLEKLTGSAASQEISRIFGTRRFITVLTSARHLSLSWANFIQSPKPPPTSWRSILILSSHLRLGLPNVMRIFRLMLFMLYTYRRHWCVAMETAAQWWRHIVKLYRGADKSLARPTSRLFCLIVRTFRLMLVLLYIYIYI